MRGVLCILVLSVLYVATAVDIYVQGPVKLMDCRGSSHLTDGKTQATTHFTEKPADPKEFYDAASDGDLQFIENEILRLGTSGLDLDWQNPDYVEEERTALHVAVEQNKPSIVSALLEAGADPNVQTSGDRTPVNIAAREGYINVIRLLVDPKYQADVNLVDRFSETPVYIASEKGHCAALELLLAQGRGDPNIVSKDEISPLMTASSRGHLACVRALLAAGAHINYANNDGHTALHFAEDEADVALLLLEAGANKNLKDIFGERPADASRSRGDGSVARIIENY